VCSIKDSRTLTRALIGKLAKDVKNGTYEIGEMTLVLTFKGACTTLPIVLEDPSGGSAGDDISQAFDVPSDCKDQLISSAKLVYSTSDRGPQGETIETVSSPSILDGR